MRKILVSAFAFISATSAGASQFADASLGVRTFTAAGCSYPWDGPAYGVDRADHEMLAAAQDICGTRQIIQITPTEHFDGPCRGFSKQPSSKAIFVCSEENSTEE